MNRRIPALLVVAAFVAGCGSDDAEPSATPPGEQTTSSPSLAGTYERQLTRADVARTADLRDESGAAQETPKPGPLELTLKTGTLSLTDVKAGLTIRQDFSATSDGALRIGAYQAPEEASFCGPEISQTASYTWEKSGDVLILKADQDECADRDSILSGEWRRR
jgi:hypothetical protein